MPPLNVLSPQIQAHDYSEAEILGTAIWLWSYSKTHCGLPISALNFLLYPVIRTGQYALLIENDQPVGYAAWAMLDEAHEATYLKHPGELRTADDWRSGTRCWVTDFIAPFGHTAILQREVKNILSTQPVRFLRHKGTERGLKVIQTHGSAVLPAEASHWFQMHPISYPTQNSTQVKGA